MYRPSFKSIVHRSQFKNNFVFQSAVLKQKIVKNK